MSKKSMDYQRIIDVCKVIGAFVGILSVLVTIIGLWAYFKNKEVVKVNETLKEKRIVENESKITKNKEGFTANKKEILNLKRQMQELINERRQISINYGDLSKEEQDHIFRDRFNLNSEEIGVLIEKATRKTQSYISQAMGYELKYHYDNAIKYYKKALNEAASQSDKTWILYSLGNRYFDLNDYENAENKYQAVLSHYNDLQDKSNTDLVIEGNIYACLGIIERRKASNYEGAINYHEKAIAVRNQLVNKDFDKYAFELSKSYNDIAVAYKHYGALDEALDNIEQAIGIRKKLVLKFNEPANSYYLSRSLSNLANIYFDKGENLKHNQEDYLLFYTKSKSISEEAINLVTSLKNKINLVKYKDQLALLNINYARTLHALGDYQGSIVPLKSAISSLNELIQINKEEFIEKYAGAKTNLARTYRDLGEVKSSITMFEEVLDIQINIFKRTKTGDSEIQLANTYCNLAFLYHQNLRDDKNALLNFRKAHNIYNDYPDSAYAKKWNAVCVELIEMLEQKKQP
ncbi:tetratricopeptide repeat protein [Algibacter amylolyticus]|uniref:Tetratricopeptide repeat protein n=1 Tax=Algibacter amylolyticus TaxID=1608400 RepID=A0A5M7BBX2_9FLAO|nr:tetratricopeptide repeat protein [Algibacter amylolyticus]KAA5826200.1 tetratricopeptide repeat protein [Algibacter amylolyticus]MBB5268402.1 tetratricopeptide (TPR) repeat protein [Algibacter amylolyticus]TSJ80238.1 tetratricopeptide repeat protein [Algibacter amylolyticus]